MILEQFVLDLIIKTAFTKSYLYLFDLDIEILCSSI